MLYSGPAPAKIWKMNALPEASGYKGRTEPNKNEKSVQKYTVRIKRPVQPASFILAVIFVFQFC
jgi:hypothetical protein